MGRFSLARRRACDDRDGRPTGRGTVRPIELTASLQHPHIVPVFDSGNADGQLFFVMPLIEGESLRARLQRAERLDVEAAVRIVREIADALEYAHLEGVPRCTCTSA